MKFYQYLIESRSNVIDEKQAIDFLEKNYEVNDTKIYRGNNALSYDKIYIIDPKNFNRKSKNTANYYTLLIDNSPRWSKYPKRSKSIICSTDYHDSGFYGKVFLVIPEIGSKIGICPKSDIWDSFVNIRDLNKFNNMLGRLFELDKRMNQLPKTHTQLLRNFKILDDIFAEQDNLVSFLSIKISRYIMSLDFIETFSAYVQNLKLTTLEALEKILDPNINGFEIATAGNFNVDDCREVWTDGVSILMSREMFNKLMR